MTRTSGKTAGAAVALVLIAAAALGAQNARRLSATLAGTSRGSGGLVTGERKVLRARIDEGAESVHWSLSYSGISTAVTQAHIHFGQPFASGGISVWLCNNSGVNPPAGLPGCPLVSGTVSGTFTAADVVGPGTQGLAPGDFDELVRAMKAGLAYANVHSTQSPGGEIRGQIRAGAGH